MPDAGGPRSAGGPAASLAEWAAALLALDPAGCGGVFLRGPSGPETDAWRALARRLAEPAEWRPIGPSVEVEHLTGGLDIEATLAAGAPRRRPGILDRPSGSVLEVRWPAFLDPACAAALVRARNRFGIVAFQPVLPDDEPEVWGGLIEPLSMWVVLAGRWQPSADPAALIAAVRAARGAPTPGFQRDLVHATVQAVHRLGLPDDRSATAVVRLARGVAALRGAHEVDPRDVEVALALVALPRTGAPAAESPPEDASAGPPPESAATPPEEDRTPSASDDPSDTHDRGAEPAEGGGERLVAAAEARLPPDVLATLVPTGRGPRAATSSSRSRARRPSGGGSGRGRTLRARRGRPGRGRRLHLLETLRAAAPHQSERAPGEPLVVRPDHLRVRVVERRHPTTVVFALDASGSQAVARLGEVKGAVERLLTESYRRRDHVALVVFRGEGAELVLPPTRSLTRVRRVLAELPGGGGTPLAHGLSAAVRTAAGEERAGRRPLLVLLTDGRANVPLGDGRTGKEAAKDDALAVARSARHRGWPALVVDSSRRASPFAAELADALGGRLLRLPGGGCGGLADAVATMTADGPGAGSEPR